MRGKSRKPLFLLCRENLKKTLDFIVRRGTFIRKKPLFRRFSVLSKTMALID